MITPYNGFDINSELKKNVLFTKSFDFTVPKSDGTWILKNLNIVSFIGGNTDNTYEKVRNASKIKLLK
jgi:hypothetical protein